MKKVRGVTVIVHCKIRPHPRHHQRVQKKRPVRNARFGHREGLMKRKREVGTRRLEY